jgi:hypothetical protein
MRVQAVAAGNTCDAGAARAGHHIALGAALDIQRDGHICHTPVIISVCCSESELIVTRCTTWLLDRHIESSKTMTGQSCQLSSVS